MSVEFVLEVVLDSEKRHFTQENTYASRNTDQLQVFAKYFVTIITDHKVHEKFESGLEITILLQRS